MQKKNAFPNFLGFRHTQTGKFLKVIRPEVPGDIARNNKFVVFLVTVVDVALYFSYLPTSQVSAFVIDTSFCPLKRIHDIAGVHNPMVSPFIKNIVEGGKRQSVKPVAKKSPISPEALTAHYAKYAHSSWFSHDVRKKLKLKILTFYLHQVKVIFKHISAGLSSAR